MYYILFVDNSAKMRASSSLGPPNYPTGGNYEYRAATCGTMRKLIRPERAKTFEIDNIHAKSEAVVHMESHKTAQVSCERLSAANILKDVVW